ncbi:hypothetical protein EVJ29_05850 [Exiguobacterium sp. SH4S7]|uniref:hypothetical protein n=1 Tax=Exiguobacterium sp. SH4S7 TaxID=2510958 RepID=UPI00103F2D01|nr:hypothetical protein [Exiguobacterium sp. SH4S7]TCI37550.1 hypothetical protein EVJ29_05850 [Exiguobacterium sp. SH4S7]
MDNTSDLIGILVDKTANDAERDDAAIDLGFISNNEAVEIALLTVANDEGTDEMIRESCGESLAQIWIENNVLNLKNISLLTGIAFFEALEIFKKKNSE